MPSQHLDTLNRARRMLATATNLDEIKAVRDQAEAVRQYAKSAALGLELQNRAAEVKLLSERRAGEILAGLELPGGDRKSASRKKVSLRDLGISPKQSERWQLLASLPEETFRQHVAAAVGQDQELTTAGLLRLARSHRRAAEPEADRTDPLGDVAASLRSMAAEGRSFACIYADPSWTPASGRRNHLGTAEILQSLLALPVAEASRRNAHLHLWTPPELLVAALQVLNAWGFRYQTCLVRAKPPADYGRYWRTAHEVLLLGVRGTLAFRDNSLLGWDGEETADRSAAIRRLIERASPGPYLDLLGSGSAPGWTFAAAEPSGPRLAVRRA
jgi:N6-adenosine-specific RNA methylase IME4